ncbi:MAG: hypothetical protein K6T88_06290 [Bacillus sp. (in: Bacteria)]|nr:hypothetical protein [Bacillus sp. (in: firmicutes)]
MNIDHALQGAELTLVKAQEKVEKGDTESAVLLSIAVLAPVIKMLQYADDSNGSIGIVMNKAIHTIDAAVTTSIARLNDKEQKGIFDLVLKEALKEHYSGWSDWRFALLRICTYFSPLKDLRKKLEKQLEILLEKKGSSWSVEWDIRQVKLLQHEIIERCDGVAASERFINENIKQSEFREMAIANMLKQGEYEKVIPLCLEGEEADKSYQGLVWKWREYRYQAYELLGDVEQQRQLAIDFLLGNHFNFYSKLKGLYTVNNWNEVLKEILESFEKKRYHSDTYLSILKEENLSDQLLTYCRNSMSSITDLYPYLINDYLEEVNGLFSQFIKQSAVDATDRKKYRKVCALIKTYKKACGTIQSHKLIGELREEHNRRPAFLDELGKIR